MFVRTNRHVCPLLEPLDHIPVCHVWHLCIDEFHVQEVITFCCEALAVGLCAMCC